MNTVIWVHLAVHVADESAVGAVWGGWVAVGDLAPTYYYRLNVFNSIIGLYRWLDYFVHVHD